MKLGSSTYTLVGPPEKLMVAKLSRSLLQCRSIPGRYQQSLGKEGCSGSANMEGPESKTGRPGCSHWRQPGASSSSLLPSSAWMEMLCTGHGPKCCRAALDDSELDTLAPRFLWMGRGKVGACMAGGSITMQNHMQRR
jgi:hypothetical protein